jgi:hypothetical protein
MKLLLVASAVAAMTLSQAAFAQSQNQMSGSSAPSQSTNSNQHLAAAQKIQKDLQQAGFTDVKVVAESFVVQAKSKDGDPVLMTIGPHGMSVFEAMNSSSNSNASSKFDTTGSTGTSHGSSSK